MVLLISAWQVPGYYFKLGHDRFLPKPFQFIIHLSPFPSMLTEKASVNELQINK
jgi:hypothetical protein